MIVNTFGVSQLDGISKQLNNQTLLLVQTEEEHYRFQTSHRLKITIELVNVVKQQLQEDKAKDKIQKRLLFQQLEVEVDLSRIFHFKRHKIWWIKQSMKLKIRLEIKLKIIQSQNWQLSNLLDQEILNGIKLFIQANDLQEDRSSSPTGKTPSRNNSTSAANGNSKTNSKCMVLFSLKVQLNLIAIFTKCKRAVKKIKYRGTKNTTNKDSSTLMKLCLKCLITNMNES